MQTASHAPDEPRSRGKDQRGERVDKVLSMILLIFGEEGSSISRKRSQKRRKKSRWFEALPLSLMRLTHMSNHHHDAPAFYRHPPQTQGLLLPNPCQRRRLRDCLAQVNLTGLLRTIEKSHLLSLVLLLHNPRLDVVVPSPCSYFLSAIRRAIAVLLFCHHQDLRHLKSQLPGGSAVPPSQTWYSDMNQSAVSKVQVPLLLP